MFRHLLKLMWNQKRIHTLLIVEILASFLVLFGLASLVIYNVRNYIEPLGFSYKNVWAISIHHNQDTLDVPQKLESIAQQIRMQREVEAVSRMGNNFPFSSSRTNSNVSYKKASVMTDLYSTDADFGQTLDIPIVRGKWYQNADSVGKYIPVVINQLAQEQLFGNEDPLGKVVSDNRKVVGVVGHFKAKGEFSTEKSGMFELMKGNRSWDNVMLVSVKPGTDALFEARLVKMIVTMNKGWNAEIDYLTSSRQNQANFSLIPMIIFGIICGFLLINVALGIFGVLNVTIARRRSEIGLRRALGATEGVISGQFVGEVWLLASFALVIGTLLAGQFPLLNVFDLAPGIYVTAIGTSAIIIYLLVTICALYPSFRAATVQPAVALHEE